MLRARGSRPSGVLGKGVSGGPGARVAEGEANTFVVGVSLRLLEPASGLQIPGRVCLRLARS